MSTTTYAERARAYLQAQRPDAEHSAGHAGERDKRDKRDNELIDRQNAPAVLDPPADQPAPAASGPELAPSPPSSEAEDAVPLDEVIAASVAGRLSLPEIEERLARRTARAAAPDAMALDHLLVRDWTAVRAAKLAGRDVVCAG